MSQMHGSDLRSGWSLFEDSVHSLLMETGLKEILELGKSLIHIGSKLDLSAGALFDQLQSKPAQIFKLH